MKNGSDEKFEVPIRAVCFDFVKGIPCSAQGNIKVHLN